MNQRTGLNGYAKFNGDIVSHYSKPRPNSLHADMLPTASSSSSELLTPTPGSLGVDRPPLTADPVLSEATGMTTMEQGNGGAESNWKRATRKLSLTSAVLGFAKKEKHKDKLGGIPSDPA